MNRGQKTALAGEMIVIAVEELARLHRQGELCRDLNGVPWPEIAGQLAVWLKRLPGNVWHPALPDEDDLDP